jgi:hypothetical protein
MENQFINHLEKLVNSLQVNTELKNSIFQKSSEAAKTILETIKANNVIKNLELDATIEDSVDVDTIVICLFIFVNNFKIYIDLYFEENCVESWLIIYNKKDIIIAYDGTIEKIIELIDKTIKN